MKILVAGCGNIGSVAAEDLARNVKSVEVIVADNDKTRAKAVAEKIGTENVSWKQIDVSNHKELANTLKDSDLVMGFLPGKLGYGFAEACVAAGKDLVDVSYMAENPLDLNDKALKNDVTIVPDCGLAPGISNVLVGHAASKLDNVETVQIMVGGLPEKPIPPLGYSITWSPESLIDEYTRKARIVKMGKIAEVEALTGLEQIAFPGFGKLEAFYTDGLRTLMYTIKARNMWEKTLRYPGHADKINLIRDLGFFEEKEIEVDGAAVSPRKLTAKLLGQKLRRPKIKDVVALEVGVAGVKGQKRMKYLYRLLDYCDAKQGVTAMARTTAYPASIVAQLLVKRRVEEKGVVPPENLGMRGEIFEAFLNELEKRGVKIKVKSTAD
jgi:saccharopine dehydrogenase-like NADP-dependent oxidoreductase